MSKNPKTSPGHSGHQKDASDKRKAPDGSVPSTDSGPGRRLPTNVVRQPDQSLDTGGGDDPGDGRVHGSGFTGDNGKYEQQSGSGKPVSQQPGHNADLGAEGDERDRGVREDREERALERPRSRK
jgi:hypothetical protein